MSSSPVRALAGLALAGLVTSSIVPMASAGERKGGSHDDDGRVVASGLDSPRHLTVTKDGEIYVAEAGTGGTDCAPYTRDLEEGQREPVTLQACAGTTGAVTEVSRRGEQRRVVSGLPSYVVNADIGEFVGPSDVSVRGGTLTISIGLGADPAARAALVTAFGDDYASLATIQDARRRRGDVRLRELVDLAEFEANHNPHGELEDTNPNSVTRDRDGWLIADAGGNDVFHLDRRGDLDLLAVLPDGEAPAPPFPNFPPGAILPFEPVPTNIERGPDGALYISQLTGFPFPVGGSSIWRLDREGNLETWATGLTNVTDLTFDEDGKLYAVQIANNGLLGEDAFSNGSLVRVREGDGNIRTIATGLDTPYGVAVDDDDAYVTTCAICAGGGQVIKFDLDD